VIALFTDFGLLGPYIGQVKAVLHREAPGVPVVDLVADAPAYDPKASAYLLAALVREFPPGTVFLCVVDPGVGSARHAATVQADGRWFVGPDNGLFSIVARRAGDAHWWTVHWRPQRLSATFHGRDLFAPLAARLARGSPPTGQLQDPRRGDIHDWPDDLPQAIYVDQYGNVMTGLRAVRVPREAELAIKGHRLAWAHTFSAVAPGRAFWYENAIGLAELAINRASAMRELGITVGDAVTVLMRS
jgi:S-adenosyl-L-methionine hydrolase (adenosine-forming)